MSESDDQGGAGRREVAYRLFASEFDDSDFSYSESDEERAPNYVVTPTGARVNRLFLVGVLTEVETVSEDYLRARVVDPTGPFVVYAGQYQPEALAFLESADPPLFVAVTGKARTYEPDDGNQVYTSVRPESISEVDAATRDRWVVQTAEQTLDRVARAAEARQTGLAGDDLRTALEHHGLDEGLAAGIPIALEHYGTTGDYLEAMRTLALDAARVVAGQRDEVGSHAVSPGQGDDDAVPELAEERIDTDVVETDSADESVTDSSADDPSPTADETAGDQRAGTAEPSTAQHTEDPDEPAVEANQSPAGAGESTGSTGDTSGTESSGTQTASAAISDSSTAETDVDADADTADATGSEFSDDETAEPGDDLTTGADADGAAAIEQAEQDEQDEPGTAPESGPTDGAADTEAEETDSDDLGDFEPEFELDEAEREEIESEYGTEFQSGTEVEEPGSAGIDTPDPEELDAVEDGDETAEAAESESATATTEAESSGDGSPDERDAVDEEPGEDEVAEAEPVEDEPRADADESDEAVEAVETEPSGEPESAATDEDVDLEDAVMDAMSELDEGDGADREAVVTAVVDRTGADPAEVEDAIQDALMGGRCYEPDDATLKPI